MLGLRELDSSTPNLVHSFGSGFSRVGSEVSFGSGMPVHDHHSGSVAVSVSWSGEENCRAFSNPRSHSNCPR